jgi:hypothetical protein
MDLTLDGRVLGKSYFDPAHLSDLAGAVLAEPALAVNHGRVLRSTKQADVLPLLKDHALSVNRNVKFVTLTDAEDPPDLRGEDYSPQLVDLANHTGRLHRGFPVSGDIW